MKRLLGNACVYLIAGLVIFAGTAHAACTETDPCAPKKEPGAWEKSLAFGFNYTSGNSDTTVVSILGKIGRETVEDIFDFNFAYGYGEDRGKPDDQDATNKNDFRAGTSYRYFLSERWFIGGGSTFLYDEIADIDYRATIDPFGGYYFLKDDTFKFSVDAGPSYLFEKVGGEEDNYFAPRIGDRFDWIISCTSKLYQSSNVVFDVNDGDNVLATGEVGIEAALSSSLSLVFLVRDTFDNVPAVDREKNDIAMITALKVSL